MSERELYIGIMSGTSLDGVDTALVAIQDDKIELIDHDFFAFPSELKSRVLNICIGQATHLPEIGEIDHELGHLFADAALALVNKSNIDKQQIRAIGSHGQTVFHQPNGAKPFTMQLGDSNIIAAKTGITTVADFRRKDMALGGQGAPLVPAFHHTIFQVKDSSVVVLNIGGISNISVLKPNGEVIGYDTGPGNMLMDAWCQVNWNEGYDKDATRAKQGKVMPELLARFCQEPYLSEPAPKSTGRELFNMPWLEQHLENTHYLPEDVLRTLCEFTAVTICEEVAKFAIGSQPELLICGGGAQNPLLMERIQSLLPNWGVAPTISKGVDSDYMEAMAFAWLAQRRMHNLPSNLPAVTGASRLASLGVVYFSN